jgi:hypothetical protein
MTSLYACFQHFTLGSIRRNLALFVLFGESFGESSVLGATVRITEVNPDGTLQSTIHGHATH